MTTTLQLAPALGKQCAGMIWNGYVYPLRPCKRTASFRENGRDWCAAHSKATKRARSNAKFAEWKKQQAARDKNTERTYAEHAALIDIANPAAVPELVRVARAIQAFVKERPWTGLADSSLARTLTESLAALDKKEEA